LFGHWLLGKGCMMGYLLLIENNPVAIWLGIGGKLWETWTMICWLDTWNQCKGTQLLLELWKHSFPKLTVSCFCHWCLYVEGKLIPQPCFIKYQGFITRWKKLFQPLPVPRTKQQSIVMQFKEVYCSRLNYIQHFTALPLFEIYLSFWNKSKICQHELQKVP